MDDKTHERGPSDLFLLYFILPNWKIVICVIRSKDKKILDNYSAKAEGRVAEDPMGTMKNTQIHNYKKQAHNYKNTQVHNYKKYTSTQL